jgi:hypothetical protein
MCRPDIENVCKDACDKDKDGGSRDQVGRAGRMTLRAGNRWGWWLDRGGGGGGGSRLGGAGGAL